MRTLFWGVRSRVFTVENLASIFPWPIKSLGVLFPISPSAQSPLTTCGTHKICTDRRQLSLESCAPSPGPGFSPSSLFVFPGACLRIM